MQEWGLEAMREYNHALAWDAAQLLTRRWGTEPAAPEQMVGSMVTLPLPQTLGQSREEAARLQYALLYDQQIEAPILSMAGRLWVRISAQVYNELDDLERFARAVESYR